MPGTMPAISAQDLVDRVDVLHKSGTANSTEATVTLTKESGYVIIDNESTTTDMLVSLDGTNFVTVFRKSRKSFNPARVSTLKVKTVSGTAAYMITYGTKPS